jgi:Uma2 family endonuclease
MSTAVDPKHRPSTVEEDPFRYGWRYVRERDANGDETRKQVPLTFEDVVHPQEGDFIVETPAHNEDRDYLRDVLHTRLLDRPGFVVVSNCRVDWGVRSFKPHGPDVAVFRGVSKWDPNRGTFYVAKLRARPVLAIEITSPETRAKDVTIKVGHYFQAGVPFYAIVDSQIRSGKRHITLIGYRAGPKGYETVPLKDGRLWLEGVDLWLAVEDERIVCYDSSDNRCKDYTEAVQSIQKAESRAEKEKIRAEKQKNRAAKEKSRAEKEKTRAEAAEARIQEMEAELRRFKGQP